MLRVILHIDVLMPLISSLTVLTYVCALAIATVLDDLVADAAMSQSTGIQSSTRETSKNAKETRREERARQMKAAFATQQEEIRKRTERQAYEARLRKEARFHEMWSALQEERNGFVAELKEYVAASDEAEYKRKCQLHREWEESVFLKIKAEIDAAIEDMPISERHKKRADLYKVYIDVTNKKPVFRDIVIENEYDPLDALSVSVKYRPIKDDPVKRDVSKPQRERLGVGEKPVEVPLGKYTLDPKIWSKLDATPYYDRLSAAGANKDTSAKFHSNVKLDHYKVDRSDSTLQSEFPRGKRTFPGYEPGKNMALHPPQQ